MREEFHPLPGDLVRVRLTWAGKHRVRARVVGLVGDDLLVRPFQHPKVERIERSRVSPWRAGEADERERRAKRGGGGA